MTLALLLLMPLISPLPYSVLAAIVVMALRGLLDFTSGLQLWHVSKGDFVLWLITFCTTVLLGVQVSSASPHTPRSLPACRPTILPLCIPQGVLANVVGTIVCYPNAPRQPAWLWMNRRPW